MPTWGPISRRDFIRALRKLGFEGPYPGGRHMFMVRGTQRLVIPNPHQGDIGIQLLSRLLRDAGIAREEWEKL